MLQLPLSKRLHSLRLFYIPFIFVQASILLNTFLIERTRHTCYYLLVNNFVPEEVRMKKRIKILIGIGAGFLLGLLIFFGLRHFKQEPFELVTENLSIFEGEDNTYYLRKAPKKRSF